LVNKINITHLKLLDYCTLQFILIIFSNFNILYVATSFVLTYICTLIKTFKYNNMKKLNLLIALFSIAFINAQTNWSFDSSHSTVRFAVDHMVISEVEGQFTTYEGSVKTSKDDFSDSKIKFSIDVNSVDTDDVKRDGHLKSADFFNTEAHPKMTFESTSIEKIKEGNYALKGNFTLLGITKEIVLDLKYGGTVQDPWGNTKAGIKVTGVIDRTAFGLKYNSVMKTGGLLIGEDISITCKMELIKI